jgi:hypothetical protein
MHFRNKHRLVWLCWLGVNHVVHQRYSIHFRKE